ncbi:MAG: glycosyltransferase family 4 protein [Chloroflexi bacterium]|nr:glycosyltransferase family 4 protein [Chloroflexota bacterium]
MRVALLGLYPVEDRVTSGVETVVLALSAGLVRRGIELHVVDTAPDLRRPEVTRRDGLVLHRTPHPRGDRLLWRQPVVWPLLRELKAIGADVVHAQQTNYFADAALRSGRPAVISIQGVIFREAALASRTGSLPMRLRWTIDALYERWVLARARHLIATGPHYLREELRPLTRARFHSIENPIESIFFDAPDDPGHGATALYVGQIIARKDVLTLIRAFGRVAAALPAAQLDLAGTLAEEPDYAAACQAEVRRLGLDARVRFLGNQGRAAVAGLLARANLLVLASLQETAPLVISEAMAAGRPIVATAVGDVPWMVQHEETGLVVSPGDATGLADALTLLLSRPEQRCAYGRAARALARRRYHIDSVVDRTLAVYEEVMGRL